MRPYKPWFRAATNTWYVEVAGRQQPLGRHAEAALCREEGRAAGTHRKKSQLPFTG